VERFETFGDGSSWRAIVEPHLYQGKRVAVRAVRNAVEAAGIVLNHQRAVEQLLGVR